MCVGVFLSGSLTTSLGDFEAPTVAHLLKPVTLSLSPIIVDLRIPSLEVAVRLIFPISLQPMDHAKTYLLTNDFWNTDLFGLNRYIGQIENTDTRSC